MTARRSATGHQVTPPMQSMQSMQSTQSMQSRQPGMCTVAAGHRWSQESVRELIRAIAPTGSRQLTDPQRDQLRRMVEHRWQDQAECAGSADQVAWYPGEGSPAPRYLMRVCAVCPVRRSCLAVALLWDEDGIWAGTSPGRRRDGYQLLAAGASTPAVLQLLLAQADPEMRADSPEPLVSQVSGKSHPSCEAA